MNSPSAPNVVIAGAIAMTLAGLSVAAGPLAATVATLAAAAVASMAHWSRLRDRQRLVYRPVPVRRHPVQSRVTSDDR